MITFITVNGSNASLGALLFMEILQRAKTFRKVGELDQQEGSFNSLFLNCTNVELDSCRTDMLTTLNRPTFKLWLVRAWKIYVALKTHCVFLHIFERCTWVTIRV